MRIVIHPQHLRNHQVLLFRLTPHWNQSAALGSPRIGINLSVQAHYALDNSAFTTGHRDATSGLTARFVRHDSTEDNIRLLWSYLERHGRPVAFNTEKGESVADRCEDRAGREGTPARPAGAAAAD
jgi:hypothetical protein